MTVSNATRIYAVVAPDGFRGMTDLTHDRDGVVVPWAIRVFLTREDAWEYAGSFVREEGVRVVEFVYSEDTR